LKIITAFKSGGIYTSKHIERLAGQVRNYSGLELVPVFGEFPHWWCKMNIFQVQGPCLFFDLDTTIVDDLSPLLEVAENHRFVTLRDFNHHERVQSSVMSWNDDMSHIYDEFAIDPEGYMSQYPGGDQDFIMDGSHSSSYWQDLLPNNIQSYKVNIRRKSIHPDCRVVAFHGNPRPWAIPELVKE